MILTKNVDVKIINHNKNHYLDLGYDIKYGDIIKNVPVNHLSLGSHIVIDVKCDKCGFERQMRYQDYMGIFKKSNEYLCNNCSLKRSAKKLGVKNISQLQTVKDKKIETNLKNWGVENVFQSELIIEKMKETFLEKYGVSSYTKTDEYNEKTKKTHLERCGFNHHMQSKDIFLKSSLNGKKSKIYNDICYTGTYELDFLKHCEKINIFNDIEKVYSIPYIFSNKKLLYHPDFFIKEHNLIIEIKSDYHFYRELEQNFCKQQGCIDEGYNFIFIINKDYRLFDCIIKNNLLK